MKQKLNIILITIDCLRADHIGYSGNSENLTPNIDKLAEEGILFKNAIANGSSTPSSFPSIFTSTYPLMYPDYPKISELQITITEILKNNGFNTGGFNSNPHLSKFYNYNKGFNYFDDIFSKKKKRKGKIGGKSFVFKIKKKIYALIRKFLRKISSKYKLKNPPYLRAEEINRRAFNWIRKSESNFFLWMHYMDTHYPFLPPERYRDVSIRHMFQAERIMNKDPPNLSRESLELIKKLYKGTIRYVDEELGKFFNHLKDINIYNNSLIIITADHGEEFKEHGRFKHYAQFYDELIHVPLIIKGPNLPEGKVIENLISLIDLAPFILDYLNLYECENFLGESFKSILTKNGKQYDRKGVISESLTKKGNVILNVNEGYRITSYRTDKWKYIKNDERKSVELYDLIIDPYEKKDISSQNKEIVKKFEEIISRHIEMELKMHKMGKEMENIKNTINKLFLDDLKI
ncbi:MAG: sulfatase [Candidatus Hermodarchaeota archaeon]